MTYVATCLERVVDGRRLVRVARRLMDQALSTEHPIDTYRDDARDALHILGRRRRCEQEARVAAACIQREDAVYPEWQWLLREPPNLCWNCLVAVGDWLGLDGGQGNGDLELLSAKHGADGAIPGGEEAATQRTLLLREWEEVQALLWLSELAFLFVAQGPRAGALGRWVTFAEAEAQPRPRK